MNGGRSCRIRLDVDLVDEVDEVERVMITRMNRWS